MTQTADPVSSIGLDTIRHHLHRAVELLQELEFEQRGTEKHILENLAIAEVDSANALKRVDGLIGELRK